MAAGRNTKGHVISKRTCQGGSKPKTSAMNKTRRTSFKNIEVKVSEFLCLKIGIGFICGAS